MKSRITGISVVIVLVAILWFFNRGEVQFVGQDTYGIQPISSVGKELKSVIRLHNPNLLSCTIDKIHENFYIDGKLAGELDVQISQGIPGRKDSEFPVSIRFTSEEYRNMVTDTSNRTINIATVGEIAYHKLIGSGAIKVNQSTIWQTSF